MHERPDANGDRVLAVALIETSLRFAHCAERRAIKFLTALRMELGNQIVVEKSSLRRWNLNHTDGGETVVEPFTQFFAGFEALGDAELSRHGAMRLRPALDGRASLADLARGAGIGRTVEQLVEIEGVRLY